MTRLSIYDIADLLTSLCDKSLAFLDETTGRYRLLELVRQQMAERLQESSEREPVHASHLARFLDLAEEAEPLLRGQEQKKWLDILEAEHNNLRASLDGSQDEAGSAEEALRLCGSLSWLWDVRGYLAEGRERLARGLSLDSGGHTAARAKALSAAGCLANRQGDYTAARALHEESLAIRRELGDLRGIGASLNNLGSVAHGQGDYPAARALHEECLAICRGFGDRQKIAGSLYNLGLDALGQGDYRAAGSLLEESLAIFRELGYRQGIVVALGNLGLVAHGQGDYPAARALHEESLAIFREVGVPQGIAQELGSLGNTAYAEGDYPGTRTRFVESLAISQQLGDRRQATYMTEGMAALTAAEGAPRHAALLWGAAERLREEIGVPLDPGERSRYDAQVTCARAAQNDDATFDAAWQEGRAMTLDQAVAYALEQPVE